MRSAPVLLIAHTVQYIHVNISHMSLSSHVVLTLPAMACLYTCCVAIDAPRPPARVDAFPSSCLANLSCTTAHANANPTTKTNQPPTAVAASRSSDQNPKNKRTVTLQARPAKQHLESLSSHYSFAYSLDTGQNPSCPSSLHACSMPKKPL